MSEQVAETLVAGTRWRNPTEDVVTFELHLETPLWDSHSLYRHPDGQQSNMSPRRVRHVVIQPGEEIVLPSTFDRAIQYIRDGRCESGLAPQLVKIVDGVRAPVDVHPALVGRVVAPPPARTVDTSDRARALAAYRAGRS